MLAPTEAHCEKLARHTMNVRTAGAGSSSSAMGSSVQMWAMRDARSWLRSLTARARICTPANPSYDYSKIWVTS